MFIGVNLRCAHQVRPPLSRIEGSRPAQLLVNTRRLHKCDSAGGHTYTWNPSHVRESLGVGALDTVDTGAAAVTIRWPCAQGSGRYQADRSRRLAGSND
jgi:hypothetical protein